MPGVRARPPPAVHAHATCSPRLSTPPPRNLQCAACWAFAAMAAIESMLRIKNTTTIDLSEQQMVDCVNADLGYSSMGCSTGHVEDAFTYAATLNVTTESVYPYKCVRGSGGEMPARGQPRAARAACGRASTPCRPRTLTLAGRRGWR